MVKIFTSYMEDIRQGQDPYRIESKIRCSCAKKYIYYYIQNYNFACCFVWVETWSLIMREERGMRVFENRVLGGGIFGTKRDEVTGEWRKLHNEELNVLYCSQNIVWEIQSRRMRWVGHVARMGERRLVYRVLVGKPEGKSPLGRPWSRWEDNTKKDLQEVGCGFMDWTDLAQDRDRWRALTSAVMNLWVR